MPLRIGIPREVFPGERRVAGTPRTVKRLVQMGFEVRVQAGAGREAEHYDSMYDEVGATLLEDVEKLWADCDIFLKVRPPEFNDEIGQHEADLIREGSCLIGFIWPGQNKELLEKLKARKVTTIAMDCVPRITRAQKVDALSAMANAAGYRAVIEASNHYPRFFAGQTTAAGTVTPAKVLIIGAGVAGLAAIGAARGLGAIVRAFDTRPEVAEQVESMGAEFLRVKLPEESGAGEGGYAKEMSETFLEAERKLFAQQAMEVNIIITTALIPGKDAPKLITAGMVESMREGSVIVDLAAQQGGNCTLTQPDRVIVHQGVRIIGHTDLLSRMAIQTSWLYGMTLVNMIEEMGGAEDFEIDPENEVVRGAMVTHRGEITWPPPRKEQPKPERTEPPWNEAAAIEHAEEGDAKTAKKPKKSFAAAVWLLLAVAAMIAVGWNAPESFLKHLTVFVLAVFVGWQVIWNVTPALHTPLMSVTNAISGIILIGGVMHISGGFSSPATWLGFVAVLIAAINVAGGFLITRRMLSMFHK